MWHKRKANADNAMFWKQKHVTSHGILPIEDLRTCIQPTPKGTDSSSNIPVVLGQIQTTLAKAQLSDAVTFDGRLGWSIWVWFHHLPPAVNDVQLTWPLGGSGKFKCFFVCCLCQCLRISAYNASVFQVFMRDLKDLFWLMSGISYQYHYMAKFPSTGCFGDTYLIEELANFYNPRDMWHWFFHEQGKFWALKVDVCMMWQTHYTRRIGVIDNICCG